MYFSLAVPRLRCLIFSIANANVVLNNMRCIVLRSMRTNEKIRNVGLFEDGVKYDQYNKAHGCATTHCRYAFNMAVDLHRDNFSGADNSLIEKSWGLTVPKQRLDQLHTTAQHHKSAN